MVNFVRWFIFISYEEFYHQNLISPKNIKNSGQAQPVPSFAIACPESILAPTQVLL